MNLIRVYGAWRFGGVSGHYGRVRDIFEHVRKFAEPPSPPNHGAYLNSDCTDDIGINE